MHLVINRTNMSGGSSQSEDNNHQIHNYNMNYEMFHHRMHEEVVNTTLGYHDYQTHLTQGRFGAFSKLQDGSNRNQPLPQSMYKPLTAANVAELSKTHPSSGLTRGITSFQQQHAPTRRPVSASNLKCPIMKLRKPTRQNTSVNPVGVNVDCQNIAPNTHFPETNRSVLIDSQDDPSNQRHHGRLKGGAYLGTEPFVNGHLADIDHNFNNVQKNVITTSDHNILTGLNCSDNQGRQFTAESNIFYQGSERHFTESDNIHHQTKVRHFTNDTNIHYEPQQRHSTKSDNIHYQTQGRHFTGVTNESKQRHFIGNDNTQYQIQGRHFTNDTNTHYDSRERHFADSFEPHRLPQSHQYQHFQQCRKNLTQASTPSYVQYIECPDSSNSQLPPRNSQHVMHHGYGHHLLDFENTSDNDEDVHNNETEIHHYRQQQRSQYNDIQPHQINSRFNPYQPDTNIGYNTHFGGFGWPEMAAPDSCASSQFFPHEPSNRGRNGYQDVIIREEEINNIVGHLQPGVVLQVKGPPMVGKSTTVRQAVDAFFSSQQHKQLMQHNFFCKGISNFQDLLNLVAKKLCLHRPYGLQLDIDTALNIVNIFLQQNRPYHHIFVFHKCENLKEHPHDKQFLDFLTKIVNNKVAHVTIVFTTYKYFWIPPSLRIHELELAVLSIHDVMALLVNQVPSSDLVTYAQILVKTFCFPEAVLLIAEKFLTDVNHRVTPDALEKKINNDRDFLSELFGSRLKEVENWISNKELLFLTHFGHSIDNSFTEGHLEYVNSSEFDQIDVSSVKRSLMQNHVVRQMCGQIKRLVIHPLAVYFLMTSGNTVKQLMPKKWFDNTCNRYTCFLGRILMSAEANMQEHGRRGLVFGALLQDWSNVRNMILMALNCNVNTYKSFINVAVAASGFIFKCFPREAESFYFALYNGAKEYGSQHDFAVMEAMFGNAVSEGSGISEGRDWEKADQLLTSAIGRLSKFGNSYFLGWALLRKAIMLQRQGKYIESLEFYEKARNVLRNIDRWALGEMYAVSEAKIEEEIIIEEIYETVPIIFTGHNKLARERLDHLQQLIQNNFENHPEIATLLNLIGLTEQRGNKDLDSALRWYMLSYHERMYLEKVCPENLLAVLNNIGVILFHRGKPECMKYLKKALDIRRECGWTHYSTALTLVHLAEILTKLGKFAEAFKNALEADRILAATTKDHDLRLRVSFILSHIRVALRQALESGDARNEHQGHRFNTADRMGYREQRIPSDDHSDSITSSHLFVEDYDPFCNPGANSIQHHDIPPDITAVDIEPCDLQKSPEYFLEKVLSLAKTSQGTLSDDGLSLVLCSYEHAVLLNLKNSREKFQKYKDALLEFTQNNPWTEETGATNGAGIDSKYRCLIKHQNWYRYVMRTPYDELDLKTIIELMQAGCLTCQFAPDILCVDMWMREAEYCIHERERQAEYFQPFDRMRINPFPKRTEDSEKNYKKEAQESTVTENNSPCGLPDFNALFSCSSLQHPVYQHPEISLGNPVLPRIEENQKDILKKIQNSTDVSNMKTGICIQNQRKPVEQGYPVGQGSGFNINDPHVDNIQKTLPVFDEILLPSLRESQDTTSNSEQVRNNVNKKSVAIDTQVVTDTETNIVTELSSIESTYDILSKSRRLLEKLNSTTEDDLSNKSSAVYKISEGNTERNSLQTKPSVDYTAEKFSVLDYLKKNYGVSGTEASKTESSQSQEEKKPFSVSKYIQESMQNPLEVQRNLDNRNVSIDDNNVTMQAKKSNLADNVNEQLSFDTTHSENNQFPIQNSDCQVVQESMIEKECVISQHLPVLRHFENKATSKDSHSVADSGLDSENNVNDCRNHVGKETNSVRSRSTSSSSLPTGHVTTASNPESGYSSSQQYPAGARPRHRHSGTITEHTNFKHSHQGQGFSEINFQMNENIQSPWGSPQEKLCNFMAVSDAPKPIPHTQYLQSTGNISHGVKIWHRAVNPFDCHHKEIDPAIDNQAAGCSHVLNNQSRQLPSREAVEQSWNETLTVSAIETEVYENVTSARFRPQVFYIQAQTQQVHCEQSYGSNNEEQTLQETLTH